MFAGVVCAVRINRVGTDPIAKDNQVKPGEVYRLDTGDVVAISSGNVQAGSRACVLHVVQLDGTLHLPFGKLESRGKTIPKYETQLQQDKAAQQHGMVDVVATIVDLRNSDNDHILQNLQ